MLIKPLENLETMPQRRINLGLIPSINSRMETFRKRKKSIFKKLDQIRKLCGVQACAVIKNPLAGKMEAFPSETEVKAVVERFNTSKPAKFGKFSMNQESQLRKTILEFRHRLERQKKKNNELVTEIMVNGLGMEQHVDELVSDATSLSRALGQKIKEVDERINQLKGLSLGI